jgi:predicted RND superfamily exporter protein
VLALAMVVTIASAYYAASHFQINTRTRNFISSKVPWRQDMIKMDKAFPQGVDQIVVVIDGKTMELAEAAAQRLAEKLPSRPELYQSVERQNGGPFSTGTRFCSCRLPRLVIRRRNFPRLGLWRLRPI